MNSLYVASRETHQVWRVEPNGEAYLVAGTGEPGFSGDTELAVDAQLHGPRGVAL
jgi:serine/threonine-protein kinase